METIKTKKTKIPFFAPKEPFRAKKIFSFNIIIILNIFFLKNKISNNNIIINIIGRSLRK